TDVAEAVAAASAAAEPFARTSAAQRSHALHRVARRITERTDEIAELITAENGKPLRWARAEAGRAASVFHWAAEEARRFSGEWHRLDTDPQSPGGAAFVGRFPRGPVLGITPFNFPLNLVAHKVAPALAVAAPIVVKPAPAAPLSALLLGELLAETDLPPGSWSVLPVPNDRMPALVTDPRLPVVSFTGSGPVGRSIREAVPHKHVTLELGGNAAAVVCEDWSTPADLAWAAERIAVFATYQAGQSCIAVQRVFADRSIAAELTERVVERVAALATGDPREERTQVGPLIDEDAARRVQQWVAEAADA
ncbi:aldehyde dehydrogenase family protein, partial [Streptomonospora algeriensis]